MIDIDQARAIAQRELDAVQNDVPVRLSDQPIDRPQHWVFAYNSVEYFETGRGIDALYGQSPFAVSKIDGSVTLLKSAFPIEDQV